MYKKRGNFPVAAPRGHSYFLIQVNLFRSSKMPKRRYRLNLFSIINETFGSSKQFVFSTFLRNPYFRRPAKFGKPKGVVFDENEVERYKLDLHLNLLFCKVTDWNKTSLVKFDYLVVKFILEPQRKRSVNFRKSCGGGRSWRRDWREREKKNCQKKRKSICKKEKFVFLCLFRPCIRPECVP